MKTIKFDLKLSDGTITLRTLDDLEENLSPELLTHFHSGKLAKWLRVRKLDELAEKMEALRAQHLEDKNELDIKLFKNLCEIFVSEVSEEEAREAVEAFKALPIIEIDNTEEIEQSKELMVIEQPKTKEFHLNERLLYKTFIELGGVEKNSGAYINYARGESKPSDYFLKDYIKKYSININDILIGVSGGNGGTTFLITNHHLICCNDNNNFCQKILLTDIYYLNCVNADYGGGLKLLDPYGCSLKLLVNHKIYTCNYSLHPFYLFLENYLALEKFEDKFCYMA